MTEAHTDYVRAALQAQVDSQRLVTAAKMIGEKDQEIARLSALLEEYAIDIATVVSMIHDECFQRQWCSEYDEWRAAIHERTKHFHLPERVVRHRAAMVVHVTFAVPDARYDEAYNLIRQVIAEQSDHAELEWLDELEIEVVNGRENPGPAEAPVEPARHRESTAPVTDAI